MIELKDLLGRKCKIHILINNSNLFYTGTILSIDSHQITFSDRHADIYLFQTKDVVEIHDADLKKNKIPRKGKEEKENV